MQSNVEKPSFTLTKHKQELRLPTQSWPERIKTSVGDFVRDVKTANLMAQAQLDKTAFKHIAEGGMVMLIGLGFERIMEDIWAEALRGKPLSQRPWIQFGPNTLERFRQLERSNPKTYRFVTQFSKDLATGLSYNGLSFFTHQLVPYAESEHLLGSLAVDVADALASEGLKGYESKMAHVLLGTLNNANPPSLLGLSMIIQGSAKAWENMQKVRKVRKELGGLPGKKVPMPIHDYASERRYGDKRPYNNRNIQDKVYYGKAQWHDKQPKTVNVNPEEEVLEKFS